MSHPRRPRPRPLLAALIALVLPVPATAQGTSVLLFLPTEGRQLQVGAEHTGALSASDHLSPDDRFLEAWELRGEVGASVTVDLASESLDVQLYVVGPGLTETLMDDDGGGGCNARLTFTFLESGAYRVVASAVGVRQAGPYTVRVSDRPGPAPTYGCGEADPELLRSLPTGDRLLQPGSVASGSFSPATTRGQDGRPLEAWRLVGRAGDRISIVLEADDFDAYLYLMGPGLDEMLTDDDGGDALDARIDVSLPSDGTYTVVASSITNGAVGAYTLRLEEPVDLGALPVAGRRVEIGRTVTGELSPLDPVLSDGQRGQAWELTGGAGVPVTVELASDDFDAFLHLTGPGLAEALTDDDGGGGLNSRIDLVLPERGIYRIVVGALSAGSGAFTLRVRGR